MNLRTPTAPSNQVHLAVVRDNKGRQGLRACDQAIPSWAPWTLALVACALHMGWIIIILKARELRWELGSSMAELRTLPGTAFPGVMLRRLLHGQWLMVRINNKNRKCSNIVDSGTNKREIPLWVYSCSVVSVALLTYLCWNQPPGVHRPIETNIHYDPQLVTCSSDDQWLGLVTIKPSEKHNCFDQWDV